MIGHFIKNNEFVFVLLVAVILSFAVFGNGIFNDFTFDDVSVVQNRGDLKDPSNFFNLFVSPYHHLKKIGLFRPFTMASYAINHYVNDIILPDSATSFQQAAGFRVVNIIIHALNSFLVFWLVNYLFKNRFLSYATFLLFLVHPIHTEAYCRQGRTFGIFMVSGCHLFLCQKGYFTKLHIFSIGHVQQRDCLDGFADYFLYRPDIS